MTHAEACRAGFARAGLWHLVGEGRRLEHFVRTGRWQPTLEQIPFADLALRLAAAPWNRMRVDQVTVATPNERGPLHADGGGASGDNTPAMDWPSYG